MIKNKYINNVNCKTCKHKYCTIYVKSVKGVLKVLSSKRKKVVLVHFLSILLRSRTPTQDQISSSGLASQVVVMMLSWGLNGFESQGDVMRLQIKEIKAHTSSYRFTPKVHTKKI